MRSEIQVNGTRLKQLSELKHLRRVLGESCTDNAECCRKVDGAISFMVNARGLRLEGAT